MWNIGESEPVWEQRSDSGIIYPSAVSFFPGTIRRVLVACLDQLVIYDLKSHLPILRFESPGTTIERCDHRRHGRSRS